MKHAICFVRWNVALLFLVCSFQAGALRSEDPILEELRSLQLAIPRVVEKVTPATVAISDGVGFGSGVIVSSDGLILTAGHVVNTGVSEFLVYFPGGQTAKARLLGYNLNVDAAMIQLTESRSWPFVEFGNSQALKPGTWTICLGHSGGYELGRKPPVRTGRILEFRNELLVTDATLIGGDSGGPLFDSTGKLIGIHSSIGEVISENRHVSIETFQRDWDRMKKGERWGKLPELPGDIDKSSPEAGAPPNTDSKRAKLGVRVAPDSKSALVDQVTPGTPAERVGIKVGDVIETVDGVAVKGGDHLIELVKRHQVGDSVRLRVRRGNSLLQLEVILDQF